MSTKDLAQECEAIWPCGWVDGDYVTERAACQLLGHRWKVTREPDGSLHWSGPLDQSVYFRAGGLARLLTQARENLREATRIPYLRVPEATLEEIDQMLRPQGWVRENPSAWRRGAWHVVCSYADGIFLSHGNFRVRGKPFDTTDIPGALRELLALPAWKEP